jgi:hypothetical protein
MRGWQKEALKLFREARAHATKISDGALHQACARAIEAMIAEGGCVPSDLRLYARRMLDLELPGDLPSSQQGSGEGIAQV